MKTFKKTILVFAMTMVMGASAFAASGFEFILNVPLGIGVGIPPKSAKDSGFKSGVGFDAGLAVQLGYMFQVTDGFGISLLGELGYAHDTFATSGEVLGVKYSDSYAFESFQVGLLPKFNIGAFAIGIGGGVKIPLAGSETVKIDGAKETIKYSRSDLSLLMSPAIIGYVKATFDYSIFFTDSLAFNVGLYLGYDIFKTEVLSLEKESFGSFDVGIELGLKFGPKA